MLPKLHTIRLLNGIAILNKERAAGYKQILAKLEKTSQKSLASTALEMMLHGFVRESILFSKTLENIVLIEGGKMPYGIRVDQQLYRYANDLKTLFSETDYNSIAGICDACEQMLQKGYERVLQEKLLAPDPRDILVRQQQQLKNAEQHIQNWMKQYAQQKAVAA